MAGAHSEICRDAPVGRLRSLTYSWQRASFIGGRLLLSSAIFDDAVRLRACIVNPHARDRDVDRIVLIIPETPRNAVI